MFDIKSLSDLQARVEPDRTTEGLYLEFKKELEKKAFKNSCDGPVPHPKYAGIELARDVVQFANADGGTLVIGITEGRRGNLDVAADFAPLKDPDGDRQWIDQMLRKWVVPPMFHRRIEVIEVPGDGHILAVNVEPAVHPIAVLRDIDRTAVEYPYRLSSGRKAYMSPDDVAVRMSVSQRVARIKLVRLLKEDPKQRWVVLSPRPQTMVGGVACAPDWVVGTLVEDSALDPNNRVTLVGEPGWEEFSLMIPIRGSDGPTVNVPYGLVREAWRMRSGLIGLALSARIIWDADRDEFEIEPLDVR